MEENGKGRRSDDARGFEHAGVSGEAGRVCGSLFPESSRRECGERGGDAVRATEFVDCGDFPRRAKEWNWTGTSVDRDEETGRVAEAGKNRRSRREGYLQQRIYRAHTGSGSVEFLDDGEF